MLIQNALHLYESRSILSRERCVARQDGTLNTSRGSSVLLFAGVFAIVVFIVAALHEPHSVGAMQSRNDRHQLAEVKVENSHEADARSRRIGSTHRGGVGRARNEPGFANLVDDVRRSVAHQHKTIVRGNEESVIRLRGTEGRA